MDREYMSALRGIRAMGTMGSFLKEATAALSEDELRSLVGAANFELERYKKFNLRTGAYSGHPLQDLVGKRVSDLTDVELRLAIMRKYTLSKTMVKALKKEQKRRKKT